ncbi:MAG: NAD(P)-dependent oxidoreductase [Bacteroidota bacterium]|nr:NAD(P)-dependent oxidoreductase [Bacteroidota bacterium]
MKIAITGATGFLGKYLTDYLSEKSYEVLVIARPEEDAKSIFQSEGSVFESDYSPESLSEAFKGIDVVIHLAAQTMQRDDHPLRVSNFFPVNIQLTENVMIAAQETGVQQLVQMSSNSVYSGANDLPFKESDNPVPTTIYGVSKLYAEKLGEYISHKRNINIVSLRLARLFGFGERDTVVFTKYMKLAMQKKTIEVWGEGITSVDYLYVRDAVSAIEKAISSKLGSGIYNVGSGTAYSVKEIAATINKHCFNENKFIFDKSKKEGGYHLEMDSSKFYKASGWKPHWKLEEAVDEMYKLYQEKK